MKHTAYKVSAIMTQGYHKGKRVYVTKIDRLDNGQIDGIDLMPRKEDACWVMEDDVESCKAWIEGFGLGKDVIAEEVTPE